MKTRIFIYISLLVIVLGMIIFMVVSSRHNKQPIVVSLPIRPHHLVVPRDKEVFITSNTTLQLHSIRVCTGGTLIIKGFNINIEFIQSSIVDHFGIWVEKGGLFICESDDVPTPFYKLKEQGLKGSTKLIIHTTDIMVDWSIGSQFVLTSYNTTSSYRNSHQNPMGGLPIWMNWQDERQQIANQLAIEEWEEGTTTGIEILTIQQIEQTTDNLTVCVTVTTPLRYDIITHQIVTYVSCLARLRYILIQINLFHMTPICMHQLYRTQLEKKQSLYPSQPVTGVMEQPG